MRSAPAFSDISVKPSFLRTTPAKKPRTECCCQPVAFIMAVIVVPLGCLSKARTASCLVPLRVEPEGMVPGFAGLFVRLFARAILVFVGVLLCDMFGILFGCNGTRRRHHQSPAVAAASRAGSRTGPTGPYLGTATVTLSSP